MGGKGKREKRQSEKWTKTGRQRRKEGRKGGREGRRRGKRENDSIWFKKLKNQTCLFAWNI